MLRSYYAPIWNIYRYSSEAAEFPIYEIPRSPIWIKFQTFSFSFSVQCIHDAYIDLNSSCFESLLLSFRLRKPSSRFSFNCGCHNAYLGFRYGARIHRNFWKPNGLPQRESRFILRKTAFLLQLALGCRVSELCGLSRNRNLTQLLENGSVPLLGKLNVLRKHEFSHKRDSPAVIPPPEDTYLIVHSMSALLIRILTPLLWVSILTQGMRGYQNGTHQFLGLVLGPKRLFVTSRKSPSIPWIDIKGSYIHASFLMRRWIVCIKFIACSP